MLSTPMYGKAWLLALAVLGVGDRSLGWGEEAKATVTGAALYQTHCASCHGVSGRGNGELASFLRTPPADLTRLTHKNNGAFPETTTTEFIDGRRDVAAHGPRPMPVWGLIFKDEEPIRQIVAYLRNLQPTYGTSLSGATLFQTHCASCHGVNGQGNGELVSVLRTLPADLTQLTRKNKGVFPETTLTGLIDGKHDVLAHGPRAMPVWGLIFQNAETIHKLVEHVRNLQAK